LACFSSFGGQARPQRRQHLLRPADLTAAEIGDALALAAEIKTGPGTLDDRLGGQALVAIFALPSTRIPARP
jgi:ornithine carbamoyltransferase